MDTWQRRTVYYTAGLFGVIAAYAVAYRYGMHAFEGESITLLESLQVVVEAVTTTGFGSDAPWQSPAMNVLVIGMNVTGVVAIFLALPVLVFPALEAVLSTTVPTALDEDQSGHVVVCSSYSPRVAALVSELRDRGVDAAVIEPDRATARELYETGHDVIHAEPDSFDGLERARLPHARAVVSDVSDRTDARIVLTARELAETVRVISVVEEPDLARYHELAGADAVLSPRRLLGERLAAKVTAAVSVDADEAVGIDESFEIAEIPVVRGDDLVGTTLADSGLRERTGVNVIGVWYQGEFESPPDPTTRLRAGAVLLVSGQPAELDRARRLTAAGLNRFDGRETVVLGYGEVGRTVSAALEESGVAHTVVDCREDVDVDVVGDATDPEVLRAAGVPDARSVVLALPDDTAAEFATLVIRDLNESAEIIARAEEDPSVDRLYRAGASYVLSLATVTGRMIASAVLDDEEVVALDTQLRVVQRPAPKLVGTTIGRAEVRSETGCTVVAVIRDGDVLTEFSPNSRVAEGDELVLVGTDDGVEQFTERFA
jgi:Trk K+ transport system NAD-binding subunit